MSETAPESPGAARSAERRHGAPPAVRTALMLHAGWALRVTLLAALFTVTVSVLLPPRWESTAVLLPPDRRAGDFRYVDGGSGGVRGLRKALASLSRPTLFHPLDLWEAVLLSRTTAERLVDRFALAERWTGGDREEAVRRLPEHLEFEDVPYQGYEIRARTSDRQLSADLANAAAEVLEARLRELYREDVASERSFLAEASVERAEAALQAARALAARRAERGVANAAVQTEAASALAQSLARLLAEARTERAMAVREAGAGSAAERDAEERVRALERAAASIPSFGRAGDEEELRREIAELDETAELLVQLRVRTVEHQAAHDTGVRVLDPAVPAEDPDRNLFAPLLIAVLLVPAGVLGGDLAGRLPARLPPGEVPGAPWLRARARALARFLRGRPGQVVAALGATGLGFLFAAVPLALVALLGAVFLLVLAVDLRAGWLVLVAVLPWAWDYRNVKAGFEIQFPTEPGILLLAAAWAYAWTLRPRRVAGHPLLRIGGLLVLWMAATSTTSLFVKHSVFQLVSVGGFILAGAIFPILELRRIEEIERVIRILFVSAAAASVIGIVQVVQSTLPFSRAAFYIGEGYLYNHGPYAAFLGLAMGPAFVYLLVDRWSLRSVPVALVAVLTTVATVISLSRAGWLSTAALLGVLVLVRARVFVRKMLLPLALASVVLVPAFLKSPFATQGLFEYVEVSSSADYGSNVDRLQRWIAAVRMFAARPVTGVGPGAYEMAYDTFRDFEFEGGRRGAHSEVLRAASEQGLPGVLLLGLLTLVFFRTGLRLMGDADPRVRRLAAGLCAGMFTYLVHGMVNEYWRVSKVALMLWVFVGLLGALDRIARDRAVAAAAPGAAAA